MRGKDGEDSGAHAKIARVDQDLMGMEHVALGYFLPVYNFYDDTITYQLPGQGEADQDGFQIPEQPVRCFLNVTAIRFPYASVTIFYMPRKTIKYDYFAVSAHPGSPSATAALYPTRTAAGPGDRSV